MKPNMLLLGASGKIGTALSRELTQEYDIISKTSEDFDAHDFDQVKKLVEETKADYVVNAVAKMGIDPCEQKPEEAFRLNTLLPKYLAHLADIHGATLIHFSSASVFDGRKNDYYSENDLPCPLNIYGATKLGGDAMVQAYTEKHYIFRLPITFGPSTNKNQFVERMLRSANSGQQIRVSDDVFDSPSYSKDIAHEIHRVLNRSLPFGLYHVTNRGHASLFELMTYLLEKAGFKTPVERASFREFTHVGIKNTNTPMTTAKLKPLRSWKRAADDFIEETLPEILD